MQPRKVAAPPAWNGVSVTRSPFTVTVSVCGEGVGSQLPEHAYAAPVFGCQALPCWPQGPVATSLSLIVTGTVAGAPRAAPVGLFNVTKKVSGPSTAVSSRMVTVKLFGVASPAAHVSVPLVAV